MGFIILAFELFIVVNLESGSDFSKAFWTEVFLHSENILFLWFFESNSIINFGKLVEFNLSFGLEHDNCWNIIFALLFFGGSSGVASNLEGLIVEQGLYVGDWWRRFFEGIGYRFFILFAFLTKVSFSLMMLGKYLAKVNTGLGLVEDFFMVLCKDVVKSLGDIFCLWTILSDYFLERKYVNHFIFITSCYFVLRK